METYEIIPVQTGEFQRADKSDLSYQKSAGTKLKAPIIMYVVRNENTCILVDTGCSDEAWAERYHHPIVQTEDMKPVQALKNLGIEASDVHVIVNTHLHWDHCFNNDLFPNAKIYVQRKEIQFAISPLPTQYVYYESHQLGMTPRWISSMSRFVAVEGDYKLRDGIDLIFTPGHTPGFQSVLVNTTGGRYLIASDCVGQLDNWEAGTFGLPTPSGIHIDLNEYYRSFEKMKGICDHILPGHDFAAFSQKVYP